MGRVVSIGSKCAVGVIFGLDWCCEETLFTCFPCQSFVKWRSFVRLPAAIGELVASVLPEGSRKRYLNDLWCNVAN